MMRWTYFLVLVVLLALAAPRAQAAQIVVLTEEPVAEFTLPDGSVLKNAYVWRRTSEGLMIIHDGGQFFLNYKTLPDAWRKAYAIDDSVDQMPSASTKRFDQYSLYSILERIQMPRTTITYLESERYDGQADAYLLRACVLQSILNGDMTDAKRLNGVVSDYFTNAVPLDLNSFYTGCEACSSNGFIVVPCKMCNGTGKCVKCDGKGRIKTQFGKREDDEDSNKSRRKTDKKEEEKEKDNFSAGPSAFEDTETLRCVDCRGTGKCPACRGKGTRTHACMECKGMGRILDTGKVKDELAGYIKVLNNVRDGIAPPKEEIPDDTTPAEP